MARQRCGKLNWSPTLAIGGSSSRSRNMCAEIERPPMRLLADLIATGRDQLAYQIAEVYAVRGEKEKAFEWLEIAFETHDTGTLSLLIDPLLRDLRADPRYKNLLARLGLPAAS